MRHFLTLKEFFYENRIGYAIGILWLIITNMLQTAVPKVLGLTIDTIDQVGSISLILKHLVIIAGIAVLLVIARYFWRIYILGIARKLEYYLRNKIFKHYLTLDPKFYDNHKTGDLLALASNDVNAVRLALSSGVVMASDAVIITSFAVVVMFTTIDPMLTLIALIPLPIIALAVTRFNKIIHNRFKTVQKAFAFMTDIVQENISAIRVVKTYVLEKSQIKKFNQGSKKIIDTNMHLVKVSGFLFPFVQYLASISFLIVLGYGGYLVLQQEISIGDFVAFNAYLMILTWPMMAIGYVINVIQRGTASMARINEIFDKKPDIIDGSDVYFHIKEIKGNIEFKKLNFAYPGFEPILKDFSLSIKQGETLAIFGKTGSGKSTITDILLRLYEVDRNCLFIDGIEIHKIPLLTLRNNIGYVPQDSFLFSTTIKNNIAFGKPDASMEEIIKVSKAASIYDEIMSFPDGFETIIGERGITLSGGQKQRIAIARALLLNPAILILDDSLSAVDTATEEAILGFLDDYRRTRTTIIISHRISAVKNADKIIVLVDGRKVKEGSHEELLEDTNSFYYKMYHKQLLEEEENGTKEC
jgi:ATP-binding cassette subfamily B multidrug efflux pump